MTRRLPLLALLCFIALSATAQMSGGLYGLLRDSTGCKLGRLNTTTGVATAISTTNISPGFVLTGACLNPYTGNYHYFDGSGIISADLGTGTAGPAVPLINPLGDSYFDNPQFNNADSSIYGIARRSYWDTLTSTYTGSLHLATVNPSTGVISDISPASIGSVLMLNGGSAIDPYQMVYYFFSGTGLLGVDLYTGNVLTSVVPALPSSDYFDNIAFHCGDSTLYGLMRHNVYDTIWLDSLIFYLDLNLDSTRLSLASIDPATGAVTEVSGAKLGIGYLLNAGVTIDPDDNLLYFQSYDSLIGVDIATGMVANRKPLSHSSGVYFDMMREFQNCFYATRIRTAADEAAALQWQASPNPTTGTVRVQADAPLSEVRIHDLQGRLLITSQLQSSDAEVDLGTLPPGMYLLTVTPQRGAPRSTRIVRM